MKKLKIILFLIFACNCSVFSTITGEFTIRGKIKNNKLGYWDFSLSTFFNQDIIAIPLEKNGSFSEKIKIDGIQDIFISTDPYIEFFIMPGDVITISWDENDVKKTLKLNVNNAERQSEINLVYKTALKFNDSFDELNKGYKDKNIPMDQQFDRTKKVFQSYIAELINSGKPTKNADKIIADAYLGFTQNYLATLNSKIKTGKTYELSLNDFIPEGAWKKFGDLTDDINNEKLITISSKYRSFLINKVRNLEPKGYVHKVSRSGQWDTPVKYSMAGMQFIKSKPVLDWYLLYSLKDFYSRYDFENAERAYQMFANEITKEADRKLLADFHSQIARLKPGSEAPAFTLKDLNGKDVSLSDFKGKLVYIDFWGIYCAPCIYQIEHYSAKLMEKYKGKDIVFLNICVDPKLDDDWKAKVKALNFEGVNLIAKGWTTNQVCKDYNVSGIPSYVLIDKEGKIITAKMAMPSRLVGNFINQIDLALR